jgi:hypothetical protein
MNLPQILQIGTTIWEQTGALLLKGRRWLAEVEVTFVRTVVVWRLFRIQQEASSSVMQAFVPLMCPVFFPIPFMHVADDVELDV